MAQLREYKLVVLGDGGVGKSSLIVQFTQGQFIEEYDPTVEDFYRKRVVIDGEACIVDIVDTAGQAEFSRMKDYVWWRTAEGFLLVFAHNDATSFDNVSFYRDQIRRNSHHGENVRLPTYAGPQADNCSLNLTPVSSGAHRTRRQQNDVVWRAVEGRSVRQLAYSYGVPYVQTSAKTRLGVETAFLSLVREIRKCDFYASARRSGSPTTTSAAEGGQKRRRKKRRRAICLPFHLPGSCSLM